MIHYIVQQPHGLKELIYWWREFEIQRIIQPQHHEISFEGINISVDKSLDWLKFSQLKGSIISGESLEITLKVLFNKAEDEKSNYFTANARLKIVNGIEENLIMHVDFVG